MNNVHKPYKTVIQCSFFPKYHIFFPLNPFINTLINPTGIQVVLCKIICMAVKLNAKLARLVSGIKWKLSFYLYVHWKIYRKCLDIFYCQINYQKVHELSYWWVRLKNFIKVSRLIPLRIIYLIVKMSNSPDVAAEIWFGETYKTAGPVMYSESFRFMS